MRTRLAATSAALVAGLVTGLVAGLVAVAGPTQGDAPAGLTAAPWTRVAKAMVVRGRAIDEASGLTRSTYRRAAVLVHNDSGDGPRVFAVGGLGRTRAVLTLRGAKAADWEDIASDRHHFLWVGDVGDNARHRATIRVIRFREPRRLHTRKLPSRTFRLRYPDGPHDSEGIMVDPTDGRLYVVTKSRGGAGVYRAPHPLVRGAVNTLQRVASAPDIVTGADFSPAGTSYVLRSYTQAFLYPRLGAAPRVIALPHQRQGESIGFDRAGTSLLIGSEGPRQAVWRITR